MSDAPARGYRVRVIEDGEDVLWTDRGGEPGVAADGDEGVATALVMMAARYARRAASGEDMRVVDGRVVIERGRSLAEEATFAGDAWFAAEGFVRISVEHLLAARDGREVARGRLRAAFEGTTT